MLNNADAELSLPDSTASVMRFGEVQEPGRCQPDDPGHTSTLHWLRHTKLCSQAQGHDTPSGYGWRYSTTNVSCVMMILFLDLQFARGLNRIVE